MAASSSARSNPANRAFIVTTTNETQNMTCAMKIVQNPVATPRLRNSVSRDAPSTISGVDIGRKISRFVLDLPRNR